MLILVLVFGTGLAYLKIANTTVTIRPTTSFAAVTKKSNAQLQWPSDGQAAVGIDGYGLLDSYGAQKPAATASVAKLITALSVLDKKPLTVGEAGPTLTIGPKELALYNSYVAQGGSVVPVNSGEQISQRDALIALLLPSANNMADGLAIWAFGSVENYITYANAWAQSHGLTNTVIGGDASGLSEKTTSTANDLVKLAILAHDNPVVAEIAAMESATIPVAGKIQNVNWLLGVDGITGLKTGNSDAAGGAFVFSADVAVSDARTVTLVGAVMQAPHLTAALQRSRTLVQSATKAITYKPVIAANSVVGQYTLPSPHITSTATTKQAVYGLYWQDGLLDAPKITLKSITAPTQSGAIVGTIRVGSDKSQTSAVVLSDAIPQASWWYRLWH